MRFCVSCGCGLILAIASAIAPPAAIRPSAHELQKQRAGAWTACTHFGPGTGNCTDCPTGAKTKCDVSRPNAKCVAYENETNCLACEKVSTACPGNKLVYPEINCQGTPANDGACPSSYDKINVTSCAEAGIEKYTCAPAG